MRVFQLSASRETDRDPLLAPNLHRIVADAVVESSWTGVSLEQSP
jgi:hypothetical protein